MVKKKVIPLSFFLIILLLISYFFPSLIMADEELKSSWEYSIHNGFEYSKRSYLLVYSPQTKEERRINVNSQCRKPYPAEGAYGKCTHSLDIQSTKAKLVLNTGEDIVLIQAPRASMILGTLEYGCCAGPDTVRFYTENGKYLGRIEGVGLTTRFSYQNMITRVLDAGNSTCDEKSTYLVVEIEGKDAGFQAIVFDNAGKMVKRIPILFTIANRDNCQEWYLSKFIKYGDRKNLTLEISGRFCKDEEGEQVFSCSASEKEIICSKEAKK